MMKRLCVLPVLLVIFFCVPASAQEIRHRHISAFLDFLVAVQADGTVKALGNNDFGQCDTQDWRDVIEVATGLYHTLGLKKDGTVYAAGDNSDGQCDVKDWADIVMIAASMTQSMGLKRDGTVVYAGSPSETYIDQETLKAWRDIVWIGMAYDLFGIDKNGRIYSTFRADMRSVRGAVAVCQIDDYAYILMDDGTLVSADLHDPEEPVKKENVKYWSDLCQLGSLGGNLLAVRKDGTVVTMSAIAFFEGWEDIVEADNCFGVQSDGTLVLSQYVGKAYDGSYYGFILEHLDEIRTWKVMVDPNCLPVKTAETP